MTINKIPSLTVHDCPNASQYRYRHYDTSSKKWIYKIVRYGKTRTKEDALEYINRQREKKIRQKLQVIQT